ncbi:MAG TPA: nodulation protein NfeD [Nitrospirae bacterium]|nr:hypothetical protein BMS3Abin09_00855 [bacterium BMS3Abin09]HDZ83884.1 nodulation protein NfeD [Nitrospirota bacterium]
MLKKYSILLLAVLSLIFITSRSFADIIVISADGVVNPVMSEFISKSIDYAAENNSELVVIKLDTPGGLDTSMRVIVKKIISSEVPVAVFVSPSGARAASAGVFITMSAHIASMSPGTNIGAAHPVSVGSKMDKDMAEKVVNDSAAYIRSIAEKKNRNSEWAEKAVRESVSITAKEALKLNVIDLVSKDTAALLEAVDGRTVKTALGERTITTKGVNVLHREMGMRYRILDIISDPNIAYILMLLGFYGLFFEFTNPGAIFPGVIGAISLILAFYSFQTLPVNYAGLMLILLAIVLFILEIKVTSYGILSIGGLISMFIGSLMLFESPLPFFTLSLKVILPGVILTTLFFTLTVFLVIKAYKRKPVTGSEGLIGMEGTTKTDIFKDGQVSVHGEIWSAWSDEPIGAGEKIVVESMEHLKFKVKKLTR